MIIDAHQHFWKYDPHRDSWIDESMLIIRKDFLPDDLKPILEANSVDGCIAVQADQSVEETQFLLDIANKNSFVKGVVGWVDLCADTIDEKLSHFSQNNFFRGVRHIVQAEKKGYMLREDFQKGISKLESYGLTYDILIFHEQINEAARLVEKFSNIPFVLDHLAKPNIKTGDIETWQRILLIWQNTLTCIVSCQEW